MPVSHTPVLWLFTDPARMPDLPAAIMALPKGLCGVVFRHDGAPGRAALARAAARACRARGTALVVAGDGRLAARLGAGVHLRGGRWPGPVRPRRGWRTSSAHSRADVVRARRAGAHAVFLSPVFPTRSHAGAAALGPFRWAAGAHGPAAFALGGVTGRGAMRLPRWCAGAGAIDALLP